MRALVRSLYRCGASWAEGLARPLFGLQQLRLGDFLFSYFMLGLGLCLFVILLCAGLAWGSCSSTSSFGVRLCIYVCIMAWLAWGCVLCCVLSAGLAWGCFLSMMILFLEGRSACL